MQKEGDQEVRVARGNGHGVLGDIRKRTWWGFQEEEGVGDAVGRSWMWKLASTWDAS